MIGSASSHRCVSWLPAPARAGLLLAVVCLLAPSSVLAQEACCFSDGTCQDILPADCATAGGTARGAGTTCGSVFCPASEHCSAASAAIPDDDEVSDTVNVADAGTICGLKVYLRVTHTQVGDLSMALTHVDSGTTVVIYDRPGVPDSPSGCGGDNLEIILDDGAAGPIEDACAGQVPTQFGAFAPANPLSAFNGESLAGAWTLTITDHATTQTGTLAQWCLMFRADTDLDGICDDGPGVNPNSNCCVANGGLGCGDPNCQAVVCGIDPFCCDIAWDGICRDEAITLCAVCAINPCAGGNAVDCDDNCVNVANPAQEDVDADGVGDACDDCEGDNSSGDTDGDGVCDNLDACPGFDDALDADGDGVADGCDDCEGDDASSDTDGDDVCDDVDACPGFDDTLDADGDGVPDDCDDCEGDDASGDTDGDGVCDDLDECAGFDDAVDGDGDGVADGCDECAGFDDANDADADGVADGCDDCEGDDAAGDTDNDGVCDDVDVCAGFDDAADDDGDGVADGCDECAGFDDANDADGDGVADGCDDCEGDDAAGDTDNDGVCDDVDVCAGFDDAADADGDGVADGCDVCDGDDAGGDTDGDGACDDLDPCPADDADDSDGDGVCDGADICDGDDNVDTDADGIPDDCDDSAGQTTACCSGGLPMVLPLMLAGMRWLRRRGRKMAA